MKLKPGDLWKVVVLVLLIIGFGVLAYHNLMTTLKRTPAGQPAPTPANSLSTTAPANQSGNATPAGKAGQGKKIFAARTRVSSSELAQLTSAPDPFRPEVSEKSCPAAAPRRTVAQQPAGFAPRFSTMQAQSLQPTEQFWLTGVVEGDIPLAVIRKGDAHYFVRQGEILPEGWQVSKIGSQSATLTKGKQRLTLQLSSPPGGAARTSQFNRPRPLSPFIR